MLIGPDIGDVLCSSLVGRLRLKLPIHGVRSSRQVVFRICGSFVVPPRLGFDARIALQSTEFLAAVVPLLLDQCSMGPRVAVGTVAVMMDPLDQSDQTLAPLQLLASNLRISCADSRS